MMGDMHRGLVSLDAPLFDVDSGFNPFGPYQTQIPSLGIPCLGIPSISWSSTADPALLSQLEVEKPPSLSWQAESCLQQSLQYSAHHAAGHNSQMETMAALNADPYSPSVNELSQMVQLYSSLYQDQNNGLSALDDTCFQSEQPQFSLIPSSSEVLQVVSSSGSHDSLSTSTDTWRSDGPNYDNVLANLNADSASVTLARDSLKNSWMTHIPDAPPSSTSRPSSFDVLPARSAADPPAFKRPRTWDEALQQGNSTDSNKNLRYSLAARTSSLTLECSLGPRASSPFQGGFYSDNRFKPAATSVEPQSVAARHRRKKISERMRVLEKLIPGSSKMDTATMLDEAIEYVKFLQLQVQILENDTSLDDDTSPNKRKSMEGAGELSLMRPGAPLVLSEVLQQQLFKQKLCLVSIRQCPPRTPPPSNHVLRKN